MKKGFTLIELLAVIVILAIIALITTPIILGIINDARKESYERSVELYASAVRNGIATHQLKNGNEVIAGLYTTDILPFKVEYDEDMSCSEVELYKDGGVYVAGCTINGVAIDYAYGTRQERTFKLNEICVIASDSTVQGLNEGAKYNCKVDPNKPAYTFFILNTPQDGTTSVNLIMDSNLRTGGEAVKESNLSKEQRGAVAWYENEETNIYGPITAMNYLQTITATWIKTNKQIINTFTDNKNNIHEMSKTYIVNARLPYYSEIEVPDKKRMWLFDYLDDRGYQENIVPGVHGYWLLSSYLQDSKYAWRGDFRGEATIDSVIGTVHYGVRPVINLSI